MHNGTNKRFRCMYCLYEYPRDKVPDENQILLKQLWDSMIVKYGIHYTCHLLSKEPTESNLIDLQCDIECRQRHLLSLISTLERYSRWTQIHHVSENTHIMTEKLTDILTRLKQDLTNQLYNCQMEYKKSDINT